MRLIGKVLVRNRTVPYLRSSDKISITSCFHSSSGTRWARRVRKRGCLFSNNWNDWTTLTFTSEQQLWITRSKLSWCFSKLWIEPIFFSNLCTSRKNGAFHWGRNTHGRSFYDKSLHVPSVQRVSEQKENMYQSRRRICRSLEMANCTRHVRNVNTLLYPRRGWRFWCSNRCLTTWKLSIRRKCCRTFCSYNGTTFLIESSRRKVSHPLLAMRWETLGEAATDKKECTKHPSLSSTALFNWEEQFSMNITSL